MKKIEELGISPWPWKVVPYGESTNSKVATYGDVEFANGESAFMKDGCVNLQKIADANLMASSPYLYESLREATEYIEEHSRLITPELMEMLTKFKSTLAKATVEEE